MKIIYYSYYGNYISLLVSYMHVNNRRFITKEEFLNIPFLLDVNYGEIRHMGDLDKNSIYVMGTKSYSSNIKKTLYGLMEIFNIKDKVIFVNTSKYEVRYLKIAIFLYKKNILKSFIEEILYLNAKKNFREISKLILSAK